MLKINYLDTDDWTKYYFLFLLLKINIKQKITTCNNYRMYKKIITNKISYSIVIKINSPENMNYVTLILFMTIQFSFDQTPTASI